MLLFDAMPFNAGNNSFSTCAVSRYRTATFMPWLANFSIEAKPKPLEPPSMIAQKPSNGCLIFSN